MNQAKQILKEIRKARLERGVTQEDAAELAGISRTQWVHYEVGSKPQKNLDTLIRMAAAVGLSLNFELK